MSNIKEKDNMKKTIPLLFLLMISAYLELKLPRIFSNNMVLQQKKAVPVWGTARPNSKVTVSYGSNKAVTKANGKGKFMAKLKPMSASTTGRKLTVSNGSDKISFDNVVVGEVWLATGQSNMMWTVAKSSTGSESINSAKNKNIRLINFSSELAGYGPKSYSIARIEELAENPSSYYKTAGWLPADNGSNIRNFSAVAYYFANELSDNLANTPIGIINTSVGGTTTECFISKDRLKADPILKPLATNWLEADNYSSWCRGRAKANFKDWYAAKRKGVPHHSFEPGFLFEAGLKPLIPFAIKGFIWYQGESNAPTSGSEAGYKGGYDLKESALKIDTMVNDWRTRWNDKRLPFYQVQLPGIKSRPWALYREMQADCLKKISYSGLAVTYDVGNPSNVHPSDKKPVGERLAQWALAKQYRKPVVYTGPIFKSATPRGNKIIVKFDILRHKKAALATVDSEKAIKGFTVTGSDGKFMPANAKIVSPNTVVVSADSVKSPKEVRYAWENDPKGNANLGNKAGLLAVPFRSSRK